MEKSRTKFLSLKPPVEASIASKAVAGAALVLSSCIPVCGAPDLLMCEYQPVSARGSGL